jgi:quercetin 2,3-dioxygenase
MMSNTEARPAEMLFGEPPGSPRGAARPEVEILTARDVPLGGARAMRVRRTLPQRARSLIGAWCFADHYGPEDVTGREGMVVPPHPHTGLQTVSWLFAGEIEHRDSLGTRALVRPGELNLMTGGHGICHSEVSTPTTRILHGAQLWVALPDAHRDAPRDFQHYVPPRVQLPGAAARVFLGELAGDRSPVSTFTPLLGAELTIEPNTSLTLDVDSRFEHGVLVDTGAVRLAGVELASTDLGYLPVGHERLTLVNPADAPARVLLLGGPPFGEEIIMWWNFIGRSHEEIVAFRDDWQAETDRFGAIDDYPGTPRRLAAPPLPNSRLKPRAAPRTRTSGPPSSG